PRCRRRPAWKAPRRQPAPANWSRSQAVARARSCPCIRAENKKEWESRAALLGGFRAIEGFGVQVAESNAGVEYFVGDLPRGRAPAAAVFDHHRERDLRIVRRREADVPRVGSMRFIRPRAAIPGGAARRIGMRMRAQW